MEPIVCDDGVHLAILCSTRPGPDAISVIRIRSAPSREQNAAKKGVHQLAIQKSGGQEQQSRPYLALSSSAIHCGRESSRPANSVFRSTAPQTPGTRLHPASVLRTRPDTHPKRYSLVEFRHQV